MKILDKVLNWLKEVLPTATLLGAWIYSFMSRKVLKEKADHENTKFEKQLKENELESFKKNLNISDADIISRAISKGASIKNGTPKSKK